MRIFDILASILALLILSPLLLLVVIILRFTGENEVFYRQQRIGKNLDSFKVIKFATMLKDSPNIGAGTITEQNDPRILPMGKLLRYSKLNEIPQLLNILMGDMSLIGPRPRVENDFIAIDSAAMKKSLSIRPGLSGIASIIFRHEEDLLHSSENPADLHSNVISPYKVELECWYVENKSVFMYFQLIILTILVVLGLKVKHVFRFYPTLPKPPRELRTFFTI